MAAPTNTATTLTQIGNREDLTEILTRVALSELTHEEVRGWVVERLLPFGG